MLGREELTTLSAWCRAHALRWTPALSAGGWPAIRLEPLPGRAGRSMMLHRRDGDFCLTDEAGNALASASGLQPVLDAVDGGVAEPLRHSPPAVTPHVRTCTILP